MIKRAQLIRSITVAVLLLAIPISLNVIRLYLPVSSALSEDYRNDGISVIAYYKYGLIPNEIVFDLREVSLEKSPTDVVRVMLAFAEKMKGRSFDKVYLSWKGEPKFYMEGYFFKSLGETLAIQNPVYTIRTLPENLYLPNGERAFSQWSGGLIGVLSSQLQDFETFNQQWYIEDMMDSLKNQ